MAKTINVFPDGREVEQEIITAYHEVNGTDYIVYKTGRDDNGNQVVGVSYKPVGEERSQKIVDMEEWKKAKGILVDDIHDKKENFEYIVPAEKTLVTEDYMRDLALRDANLQPIVVHYEEFLKRKQEKVQEAPQTINPFNATEIPEVAVQELPKVEPTPIIEEAKEESVLPQMNTVAMAPVVEEPIIPTPSVENNNMVQFPGNTTIASEPQVVNTPVQEPVNVVTPIVEQPKEAITNNNDSSAVTKYYADSMNSLVNQLNEVTEKFKEITTKYQATVAEIGGKVVDLLEEANMHKQMSVENFDRSQAILASQNEDISRDLTKAA